MIIINKNHSSLLSSNSLPKLSFPFISFHSFLVVAEFSDFLPLSPTHTYPILQCSIHICMCVNSYEAEMCRKWVGYVPPQLRIWKLISNHINHTRFNYGTKRLSISDCEATAEENTKNKRNSPKTQKHKNTADNGILFQRKQRRTLIACAGPKH